MWQTAWKIFLVLVVLAFWVLIFVPSFTLGLLTYGSYLGAKVVWRAIEEDEKEGQTGAAVKTGEHFEA